MPAGGRYETSWRRGREDSLSTLRGDSRARRNRQSSKTGMSE
jgi:hypothetical protein